MYRYDRVDSPTMPREATDAPPTPALSSSAQSPQSSSIPSTNTSTVDDPIHSTAAVAQKDTNSNNSGINIENNAS